MKVYAIQDVKTGLYSTYATGLPFKRCFKKLCKGTLIHNDSETLWQSLDAWHPAYKGRKLRVVAFKLVPS